MKASSPKIVIVGSGASGMSAAMSAVEAGARVTLISRAVPARAGSVCVREGINAGFGGDFASHVGDTLESGCHLADAKYVERMCADAPRIAELLGGMGVLFDRTQGEGRVRAGASQGSCSARSVYSGRATGARVVSALTGQMLRHEAHGRVQPFFGWGFLSLMLDDAGRCRGVVAQDMRNMQIRAFPADAVIICSGGFQSLFAPHCSSEICDGFATARACEQGALLANPEFVEVFPFTIPAGDKCRAVTGAALVEGGEIYVERDGRPWSFLKEFCPGDGCVARWQAMRAVIKARDEAKGQAVMLDISHIDPAVVEARLAPLIDSLDGTDGSDLSAIEVVPSVGLTLGGLFVGGDHATSIEGLFAAGNCTHAYHGAGALAGNELLASIHGGITAGASSAEFARGLASGAEEVPASLLSGAVDLEEDLIARISAVDGKENAHLIEGELVRAMFECCSPVKGNEGLARAAGKVTELTELAGKAPLLDRAEWANDEIFFARRLRGKLLLARVFVEASLARQESRGCHVRAEFPEQDDAKWKTVTKVSWKDGGPKFDHSAKAGGGKG